jgi:hypothetical protein
VEDYLKGSLKIPALILVAFLSYPPLFAELVDGKAEEKAAEKALSQRFLEFTGDKNVMGKSKSVEGKVIMQGQKTRFDKDDGVSYKSDLTYHDFAFKTPDEAAAKKDPKDPNASQRMLFPFISPHGGESEAGGSSQLERTVYEEHEKLSKSQEQDPKKLEEEEKKLGVKLRSVFRIETRDLVVDPKGGSKPAAPSAPGGGGSAPPDQEKIPIERMSLVEDVREKIDQVGEDSVQTIERAARDKEFQDDENTMGNIIFYYEAASRAAESWWNSTLANLGQRQLRKEVKNASDSSVSLSEGSATCESWADQEKKRISQIPDPAAKKKAEEEIGQMVQKCKKLAQQKYDAINPRFQEDPNNKGSTEIKPEGIETEDSLARDLRNQLEVLDKAGISASKLQTNWKYGAPEEKSKVTLDYDENAQPAGEGEKSVAESIEEYNAQLDEAAKGFKDVKERFPQLDVDEKAIMQYKIKPETQSVKEIMARPVQQALEEEAGAQAPAITEDPETYEELVQQAQAQ